MKPASASASMKPASSGKRAAEHATTPSTEEHRGKRHRVGLHLTGGAPCPPKMLTAWRAKEFCDVHVVASGERFAAHKLVLACGSDYMSALFQSGFSDSQSDEVILPDLPAPAALAVIEWLYAGECSLDDENELMPVLRAASRLQVTALMDACAEAIKLRLTLENVVDGIELANEMGLGRLKDAATELIAQSFSEVVNDERGALLDLPAATLEGVLALPTLATPSEAATCEAVLRWARHHSPEPELRRRLLSKPRLHWASWKYLATLRDEPLFDKSVLSDACLAKAGYSQARACNACNVCNG